MNVFNQRPAPALRPYIDRLWGWESGPAEVVDLPTLLPGTGAELYLHYGQPFQRHAGDDGRITTPPGHLFCVRRKPISLAPTAGLGFIAVRFRVGMLHRFTAIPAHEFADCQLSIDDVWEAAGAALLRHLSCADGLREKIALIESFLIDQLQPDSADALVEHGMGLLYRRGAALSIDALANTLSLGRRQLERRWNAFAGQSPSESRSLCRFQQTVRRMMLDPMSPATDNALVSGYYDQAHFVHDFRRRVGLSPGQYLRSARTRTHFYNTPLR